MNLLGDVETEIDDGTLEISDPSNVDLEPKVGVTVEITVPALEDIEVSGSGDVRADGIEGDLFGVEVSGSGERRSERRGGARGGGSLWLGRHPARRARLPGATAEISGAGGIQVHATESLVALVSGAGDITYTGDPADVEREVSGAGTIESG
jgi:hypothetical protein